MSKYTTTCDDCGELFELDSLPPMYDSADDVPNVVCDDCVTDGNYGREPPKDGSFTPDRDV